MSSTPQWRTENLETATPTDSAAPLRLPNSSGSAYRPPEVAESFPYLSGLSGLPELGWIRAPIITEDWLKSFDHFCCVSRIATRVTAASSEGYSIDCGHCLKSRMMPGPRKCAN